MVLPPSEPCIYHITHVDNLPAIITNGGLLSDAAMIARGGPTTSIGMNAVKQRRLGLSVSCYRGLNVGDCVPFYFCPRSIMLFVIHRRHADLEYTGGQAPIVHLEAGLQETAAWAHKEGRRFAFSLSNAGAFYTQFRGDLGRLDEIDWEAVRSTNFRPGSCTPSGRPVSEGKQAEFLVESDFPWHLVRRVGVVSEAMASQVRTAMVAAVHKPRVSVERRWYF